MNRRRLALALILIAGLISAWRAASVAVGQQAPAGLIAYNRPLDSGLQQVRVIRPDGTGDQPFRMDIPSGLFPVWSRDGQWLAVMGPAPDAEGSARWEVYTVDAEGENLQQVTDLSLSGAALLPLFKAFSPDGRRLALSAVGEAESADPNRGAVSVATVRVVNLDRPEEQTVVGGVAETGGSLQGVGIDWSPTEDLLVVPAVTFEESSGLPLPVTALFAVPPEEDALGRGLAHPVTFPQRALDREVDDAMPAVSPDGQRVAFVRREVRGLRFTAAIMIANLDGSGEQQVLGLPQGDVVNQVSWSGDGQSLVFDWGRASNTTVFSEPSTTGIWTIRADGSELSELKGPPALNPSWSWTK